MTIYEMKQRKKELGYTNQQLADLSGVPLGTIQKVFSGNTKSPRRETILALQKVLYSENTSLHQINVESNILRDASSSYGNKTGYTYLDYLALPEERRVELIDGIFYDMSAPTTIHQAFVGFIHTKLLEYVLKKGGDCMPFMSPVDVQLDEDDRTIVQPDVFVVCDRSKLHTNRVFGAPDFLVEILSPSTRKKDMQLKLYKYGEAGVKEYWMVDPDSKKVIVYDLEHELIPVIYSFENSVPVMIWNGECVIDFAEIYEKISFLYGE